MSKQPRGTGEDLLFSQSELAELDAELAPQPDEAELASARTPPQGPPPSLDDLVDSAFSDEATVERQPPALDEHSDLAAGFVNFEAEPANTAEILAAAIEQEPISSAPPPARKAVPGEPSLRAPIAGERAANAGSSGPAPLPPISGLGEQHMPSVMFDDSPFAEEAARTDAAELTPELAELAASMNNRSDRGTRPASSDAVLSSSPSPSSNSLPVTVGPESGGSVPSHRAPALVALSHAVDSGEAPALEAEAPAASVVSPSSSTPVVALDDLEFHVVEDSEERPTSAADAEAPSEEAASESAESDESTAEQAAGESAGQDDANIDAGWSEAAEEAALTPASSTSEDLSPIGAVSEEADDRPAPNHVADPQLSSQATPILSQTAAAAELEAPAALAQPSQPQATLPQPPASALRRTSPNIPPPPPPAPSRPVTQPNITPASRTPPPSPPPPPAQAAAPPPVPATARPVAAAAAQAPAPAPPPSGSAGGISFGEETKLRKKRRSKQWFEEIFDEDYLHTLPFLTPQQTEREVGFLLETLELPQGGRVLDVGCGYGRHAMEMAARGYKTVGLDLSLPLLIRATDAARRVGVNVDFVHGDMREMTFENEFDGAYCFYTTFGFFDDDTNRRVAAGIAKSLKPGGRFVLEMINRDYLIGDLPCRVWWQGDGCVVLEEVDFNYFTSRLQVQRQIILESGRQLEQEISIRAYSLHEIGKVLTHAGFRVLEVSGNLDLRGRFYGNESRQLIVVSEKRADA
ncbi:MAG: methyltransferase domain-containing protein [Myxococcales bacterium]|nr:methyltransferase domain-containing protein [Myxococcales bacterium]